MNGRRVLVTRPEPQATEWVQSLRAAGIAAEALPLIAIRLPADVAAVAGAWQSLGSRELVCFVSPNAVASFFAARPANAEWPARLKAASPGPGTTRSLRALGVQAIVEPAADAPQFDSETLWEQLQVHGWSGRRVLIVRGADGREWLADRFREQGAHVEFLAAYTRAAPELDGAQQARLAEAIAKPQQHAWLFSSSESVGHLESLAPNASWVDALAVATHPRIAERAKALGMARVIQARPGMADVIACIESIAS